MAKLPDFETFAAARARDFALKELAEFKALIPSKTLKAAINLKLGPGPFDFEFIIPYYWAEAYLSGRQGFAAGDYPSMLIYFANPKDDPRRPGGVPPRKGPERRLTKDEYDWGMAMNRAAWPGIFMYVVKSVGPAPRNGSPPKSRERWEQGVGPRQKAWLEDLVQEYMGLLLATLPRLKP